MTLAPKKRIRLLGYQSSLWNSSLIHFPSCLWIFTRSISCTGFFLAMKRLTKNFTSQEFYCPCCNAERMRPEFMAKLQRLRDELGVPFSPVQGGGYRCEKYAKGSQSAHTLGMACDLNIGREYYHRVLSIAFKLGFTGIGAKQKGGKFQMHIDTAPHLEGIRPRPWFWTY